MGVTQGRTGLRSSTGKKFLEGPAIRAYYIASYLSIYKVPVKVLAIQRRSQRVSPEEIRKPSSSGEIRVGLQPRSYYGLKEGAIPHIRVHDGKGTLLDHGSAYPGY